MKTKMKACFKASVQPGGTLELLVYEDIGPDYWSGGGVTAKTVKQQLDDAGVFSRISVRINSPGGDAFEGVAIMNLLRAQSKPVDVFVDGIAASAASIVAMAGDTITMGQSSMMMVHNAWSFCAGDGAAMRKMADTLDKISETIGSAYVAKTGKTADHVKAIMDAETWMSAEECVKEGFATSIAASDDDEEQMALAKSFKSLAKLQNVPAALKPKADDDDGTVCGCPCSACQDGECADCDCKGCTTEACAANACNCGNGAMDDDDAGAEDSSNLTLFEARLKLLRI